jgi:hypothetical protein
MVDKTNFLQTDKPVTIEARTHFEDFFLLEIDDNLICKVDSVVNGKIVFTDDYQEFSSYEAAKAAGDAYKRARQYDWFTSEFISKLSTERT